MIEPGSLWGSYEGKKFRVISVTEIDGNTWVYYREDHGFKKPSSECKEYSCFLESFLSRFSQMPE